MWLWGNGDVCLCSRGVMGRAWGGRGRARLRAFGPRGRGARVKCSRALDGSGAGVSAGAEAKTRGGAPGCRVLRAAVPPNMQLILVFGHG